MTSKSSGIPKNLGACADLLYRTREERYKLQKEVKKCAELENRLEEHLREQLPKQEQTGVAGIVGRAELVPHVKPIVENWDKFYAFVRKNNAFEMLQRRLNEGSARDYAEAHKKRVPGTNVLHYTEVSCTAVRRK